MWRSPFLARLARFFSDWCSPRCRLPRKPSMLYGSAVPWKTARENWKTGAQLESNECSGRPGDTASFTQSNRTSPTISVTGAPLLVTIDSITFNPGASAFTIQNAGFLTLQGVGIVNNSGVAQTINNLFSLAFTGNSTAGNATINNSSNLQFVQNSSAGNATINNLIAGQTGFPGNAVKCRKRGNQQCRSRNFHPIPRQFQCWECDDHQQWSRKLYLFGCAYH